MGDTCAEWRTIRRSLENSFASGIWAGKLDLFTLANISRDGWTAGLTVVVVVLVE